METRVISQYNPKHQFTILYAFILNLKKQNLSRKLTGYHLVTVTDQLFWSPEGQGLPISY